MKDRFPAIPALCLLTVLGGCAATTPPPSSPGAGVPGEAAAPTDPHLRRERAPDPFSLLVEELRREARELEAGGSPRQALEKWKVVSAFDPRDDEAARQVDDLGDRLKTSADRHFHQGVSFLEGGKVKKARRELLLALADYPGHGEALDLLKNGLAPDTRPHRVGEGETLETIALGAYGDPGGAVLIARLNDLSPGDGVEPGRILQLPLFEDGAPKTAGDAAGGEPASGGKPATEALAEEAEAYIEETGPPPEGKEVTLARGYLDEGSYEKAIDAAGTIPVGDLSGEGLRELLDASYYGLGRKQQREKRYREALESLGKVDPGYRDVGEVVSAVEKTMRREAEEHYLAGVRYFVDQNLEQAIVEWEETLALNPDHSKASRDLKKARRLMEELERIR
jgi:tetratricopeptide (TPR) repeat protein